MEKFKKECDMVFVKDEADMPSDWVYRCSNCKKKISRNKEPYMFYCPCCGSEIKSWNDKGIWWDDFIGGGSGG